VRPGGFGLLLLLLLLLVRVERLVAMLVLAVLLLMLLLLLLLLVVVLLRELLVEPELKLRGVPAAVKVLVHPEPGGVVETRTERASVLSSVLIALFSGSKQTRARLDRPAAPGPATRWVPGGDCVASGDWRRVEGMR
jgi:hypothetical protein